MGRIVVGVDGSRASMAALRWAVREARFRGAQVETVYVFENTPSWRVYGYQQETIEAEPDRSHQATLTSDEQSGAEAHGVVERMVDDLDQLGEVGVESVIVEDRHPARVLVERSADADMLVVGSRGHGGVSELLLGSVSHHCATHAQCPVVIIRPGPSS